jgi:hypothetical protein
VKFVISPRGMPSLLILLSAACLADRATSARSNDDLASVALATGLRLSTLEQLARGAQLTLARDQAANDVRIRAVLDFMKDKGMGTVFSRDAGGRCGARERAALLAALGPFSQVDEIKPILAIWRDGTPAVPQGDCPGSKCCLTSGGECLVRLQGGGCSSTSCLASLDR